MQATRSAKPPHPHPAHPHPLLPELPDSDILSADDDKPANSNYRDTPPTHTLPHAPAVPERHLHEPSPPQPFFLNAAGFSREGNASATASHPHRDPHREPATNTFAGANLREREELSDMLPAVEHPADEHPLDGCSPDSGHTHGDNGYTHGDQHVAPPVSFAGAPNSR
jgi:hypothetical protein